MFYQAGVCPPKLLRFLHLGDASSTEFPGEKKQSAAKVLAFPRVMYSLNSFGQDCDDEAGIAV